MEYSVVLSWRLLAGSRPGKSGKSVKRVEVAIADGSNGPWEKGGSQAKDPL